MADNLDPYPWVDDKGRHSIKPQTGARFRPRPGYNLDRESYPLSITPELRSMAVEADNLDPQPWTNITGQRWEYRSLENYFGPRPNYTQDARFYNLDLHGGVQQDARLQEAPVKQTMSRWAESRRDIMSPQTIEMNEQLHSHEAKVLRERLSHTNGRPYTISDLVSMAELFGGADVEEDFKHWAENADSLMYASTKGFTVGDWKVLKTAWEEAL